MKGAGLRVRSRDGFFGATGGNQPLDRTREAEIVHALQSPFNAGSIHPRLTALFSNSPQSGSFIDALLYFNPNELKWSTEPDGNHKASIDVAAAAFDENGLALAPVDTTFSLQLSAQNYSERLKKGMVYHIHVPVNRPGPYVPRAAVRDAGTEASGSADQFVEVPDVESGRLALSGIVLQQFRVRRGFRLLWRLPENRRPARMPPEEPREGVSVAAHFSPGTAKSSTPSPGPANMPIWKCKPGCSTMARRRRPITLHGQPWEALWTPVA